MKNRHKISLLAALIFGFPVFSFAQGELFTPEVTLYTVTGLVFLLAIIVLVIAWTAYKMLSALLENEEKKEAEAAGKTYVPSPSLWSQLMSDWTKAVPLEEEKSIELDHEYDGIRELDNHLPPWWLALFYGAIVFGAIYMFGYHVADWWPLQQEEYENEMAAAEKALAANVAAGNVIDENSIEYNDDPTYLAAGQKVYESYCFSCHRIDGGGVNGLGPNLVDAYWLHGGSIGEIFTTITYGVPSNGMAAWESSLTGEQRSQLSSYIYSLYGTNPPDAREPQGTLVEREGESAPTEGESSSEEPDTLEEETVEADSTQVEADSSEVE